MIYSNFGPNPIYSVDGAFYATIPNPKQLSFISNIIYNVDKETALEKSRLKTVLVNVMANSPINLYHINCSIQCDVSIQSLSTLHEWISRELNITSFELKYHKDGKLHSLNRDDDLQNACSQSSQNQFIEIFVISNTASLTESNAKDVEIENLKVQNQQLLQSLQEKQHQLQQLEKYVYSFMISIICCCAFLWTIL